jgi:hypothetical protein
MSALKGITSLSCFLFAALTLSFSLAAVSAEGGTFLADKHKAAGLACGDCHKETPPKQKVPSAVCQSCHGDYEKLADKTAKTVPNPHETHLGELACDQCHHAHQESVSPCVECHPFFTSVP